MMMDFYLVSYDIRDDKRRMKIYKAMKNFGERIQYSVFECWLDKDRFTAMRNVVRKLMDEEVDSVRMYKLCNRCIQNVTIEGKGEVTKPLDFKMV